MSTERLVPPFELGDRGELRGKGIELGTGGEGDGWCGGNCGYFSGLCCRKYSGWLFCR